MMDNIAALPPKSGLIAASCAAPGVSRASLHRRVTLQKNRRLPRLQRPKPRRALSQRETEAILDVLRSPRFADQAPPKSTPACSIKANTCARSAPCTAFWSGKTGSVSAAGCCATWLTKNPNCSPPAPTRACPCECEGLVVGYYQTEGKKWTYYYLYVILDIFSRCVVGWHVADTQSAALFKSLLDQAVQQNGVPPGQLTLHGDRGSPMMAKATAFLLADLGITKSHSRPYVSNDNPYSESAFKTLKYQPQFPKCFGSIEDAVAFLRAFNRGVQRTLPGGVLNPY